MRPQGTLLLAKGSSPPPPNIPQVTPPSFHIHPYPNPILGHVIYKKNQMKGAGGQLVLPLKKS